MAAERETRVLYKAIADFSQLTRKAREARAEIARLNDDEVKANKQSAVTSAAATKAKNAQASAVHKVAQETKDSVTHTKNSTKAVEEHATAIDKDTNVTRRSIREAENAAKGLSVWQRAVRSLTGEFGRHSVAVDRTSISHRRARSEISQTGNTMTQVGKRVEAFNKALDKLGNWRPHIIPPFIALIPVIGSLLGLINPLVAGFGALGGAAIGLASNIGSLAGAALGAIPALAALLGVVAAFKVGFAGVGNALKAYSAMKKAGGGGGGGTAQKEELTATEKLQRAQEKYARAVQDVQFAEEDLDDARADYIKRLNDLRKAVDRAAMSEARARANAQLAREDYANTLADPGSTKGQKMSSAVGVQEAQADLQDVRDENKQNAADLAEMQQKGIEGDRQVIQATRALTDALWAERDAQIDLHNEQSGANEATSAGASAANAYRDALNKLSPSARKVVERLIAMQDVWDQMKKTVQESIFSQFVDDIDRLRDLAPPLTKTLSAIGTSLGKIVSNALKLVTSPSWLKDWAALGDTVSPMIDNIGDALLSVLGILKDLTFAAAPFTQMVTKDWAEGAAHLADIVGTARSTGQLQAWLDKVYQRLQQWWRIIKNIGTTLFNYGSAAGDFGQWITDAFERMTGRWKDASEAAKKDGSPFKKWLEDIKPLLSSVGGLFGDFFSWFAKEAADPENIKRFTDLVDIIRTQLGPAIGAILDTLSEKGAGQQFVQALADILDAIEKFLDGGGAEGFGSFMKTVSEAMKIIGGIIEALPDNVVTGLVSAMGTLSAFKFLGLNRILTLLLAGDKKNIFSKLGSVLFGSTGAGKHSASTPGLLGRLFSSGGKHVAGDVAEAGASKGILSRIGSLFGRGGATAAAEGAETGAERSLLARIGLGAVKGGAGGAKAGAVGVLGGLAVGGITEGLIKDQKGGFRDTAGTILSGAGQGALLGGTIGSIVPGIGTAIGATAGGLIGGGIGAATIGGDQWKKTGEEINKWWDGVYKSTSDWLGKIWDPIYQFFAGLPDKIADAAGDLWENIKGIPDWLGEQWDSFLKWLDDLPSKIAFAAGYIWQSIINIGVWLGEQWNTFQDWLAALPGRIASAARWIWEQGLPALGAWLAERWNEFLGWIQALPGRIASAAQWLWNVGLPNMASWLAARWNEMYAWVTSLPGRIAALAVNIWNFLGDVGGWLADQWNKISTWLTQLPGKVADKAKQIGGNVWDWLGDQAGRVGNAFNAGRDAAGRHNGGRILRRSEGGGIPGTGNSDSVPVMATPGEFMVRKAIVNRVGPENMQALNSGVLSFAGLLRNANARKGSRVYSPQFLATGGQVTAGALATQAVPVTPQNTSIFNDAPLVRDIMITNPVPERASTSIPRAIRKVAYLGGRRSDQ